MMPARNRTYRVTGVSIDGLDTNYVSQAVNDCIHRVPHQNSFQRILSRIIVVKHTHLKQFNASLRENKQLVACQREISSY